MGGQLRSALDRSRRLLWWLPLVALVASGCLVEEVPGDAPLRYRDSIFTDVVKTSDVVYGSSVNQVGELVTLKLDLYAPQGDTNTSRPLVIWIHGGYFSGGDKTSAEIVDEATEFAKRGYVTASINYRTSPNGCRQPIGSECLQAIYDANADAQAAVRFLRAAATDHGINGSKIAIGGSSAGAITALNVGYGLASPGEVAPSDLSAVRGVISLSGAEIFTDVEDSSDAPALLFHGTADTVVPYSWAKSTAEKANAAGVEADLVAWVGELHVPYADHRDEILRLSTNFVYRALDVGLISN